MIVELISTGTELLLGQIVNTNAPYLARQLNDLGYDVLYQSTVGDNRQRMAQVIDTALKRADVVITSGGLGPTQGDITKEVTANLLERKMFLHKPSEDHIKCFFARRNIDMPESNLRQAMMPEGAIVVENHRGTAPGVIIEAGEKTIIHLPGPPMELEHMFENRILPYLTSKFGGQGIILSKVLRCFGLGESSLEEKIHDYILAQGNPTIALLARSFEIHVRITAKGDSIEVAQDMISTLEKKIRARIGQYIFGCDDQTMESIVGNLLTENKLTLSIAESCTGGLTTSRITDVPGSSRYLIGSIVSYSNRIKEQLLQVPPTLLIEKGAVSEEVAVYMAEGVRTQLKTDLGLSITGIAGPDGGTPEKPVGLVYIAVAGPKGTRCYKQNFSGQRTGIKNRTSLAALDYLRQYLNEF